MTFLDIKKIFFNNLFIKLFSLFIILIIIKLPINTWADYIIISLYTLGFFFGELKRKKKQIYFIIFLLLLFNLIKVFLPSNIILEKHSIYTPSNGDSIYSNPNLPKNIDDIGLRILNNKNNYFSNINLQRKWSFSADSFWTSDPYSRKFNNINFNNRYALNPGALNSRAYYVNDSYDLYYPLIFAFNFKKLIADEICWKGSLFIKNKNNDYYLNENKVFQCEYISNLNIENNIIFGLDLDRDAKLSIKLIHHGISKKIFSNIDILNTLLLIFFLLNLFKYSFANFLTLLVSNSFYIIFLLDLILKGLPSRFSELIYLQRGNDGLTHFGTGRNILENLYNYNFIEVLRGGSDIFYFMPGMRYANMLFMLLFGDSHLGYFLITSFIPFIIYKILRKLINKNWSIILFWCFMIVPFFESFGFFQFYYSKLAVLGFGESLSYFCLYLGMFLLIPKKNENFYSDTTIKYFFIGILFFFVVMLRPNYILQFITFFSILGFYIIYLIIYNIKKSSESEYSYFIKKYIILIIGFSPILLVTLHNWYFGNQFVLLTSASAITENLRVPPYVWTDALYSLVNFEINKESWNIIIFNLKIWINYYELWLIVVYLNLWVGIFRSGNNYLFRIICSSLIASHITYLFYAGDHRYTYGLWTISLLIFFKDFKEFYFRKFLKTSCSKLEFTNEFKPIFYKILDPIKY